MANTHQAPKLYTKVNKHDVPYIGVIVSACLSGLCLISKFIGAEKVFILIISSSGMIGCLIWIMIALSHIGFRKHLAKTGQNINKLSFKVPMYPLVPILGVIFNAIVILGMLIDPGQRIVVYSGVVLITLFVTIYLVCFKKHLTSI